MISPGYDSRSLTRKWWAIRGEAMAGLAVLVVSLLVGSVASVATLVAGLAVLVVSPLVESVGAPPGASDRCSTAKSACTATNSSGSAASMTTSPSGLVSRGSDSVSPGNAGSPAQTGGRM